jgi:predicted enzyme related to lactoylglutathione lyase
MTEPDRYIPGVPCWIDTNRHDPGAAVAFYRSLFGWQVDDVMPPEAPGHYFTARLHGGDVAAIGSLPPDASPNPAWNTYVWVQDADRTAKEVVAAGGSTVLEPTDVGDAGRMAVFTDSEGAQFSVWQARRHRGATVVNEPGSVNFNELHTRDLDAADRFYGAVFGWERIPVGDDFAWALPAYGDFLEQRTPGMRQGMKDMGAPDRFWEVVASLSIVTGTAVPHWSVTFAVEDTDAIAVRAVERGGRVIVPPFDAPWVRMAVIADPDGAEFTASRFMPPNG